MPVATISVSATPRSVRLCAIVAAAAGVLIPLTLKRIRIDPALAGGVVLTTVTDVVGFLAFLGLAALLLT